ncbi:UDP-phosphate N-acetylgalactosaminyl-1-phosphate transferase [Bacillus wiedmannii]|uniref:UDP-phosphate N-acetylgalactosaminyl-1-phosphate transferase n=1 Tax=Bacillus wiedmannii TaxID=1890302 RepID=A0A2A8CSF7_9BACI|nr:exopolysaccharide biosynthesis polyprenyl glycosylphosphotransferase [Bacillus wiedmannii]PEM93719.1 UDP-phosphate N-acetylgalactosaminyl-1-phosphate transferase [Bacillus wiedmannii]PEO81292.1 UDP-phosphate N-acetylgalactosaminyl-1-phosphate transferase [Bacillus wiedmannii]PHG56640.1 UDP-phosphate N-acetylgalactosaminyl-1-phosphate transferase [Bacillus wiedmannii]
MKLNDNLIANSNDKIENRYSKTYLGIKYIIDVILSLLGIIFASPFILMFSLLIILESPGSPFYFQERLGLNGNNFSVIKLRSMRNDAEKYGAKWAEKNDPRVTRIGLFIRKTRIDELPQLFNILKGDMSLVGPRPERAVFTEKFEKEIPGFKKRLKVKPGLTGWAQVNGGYEITPKEKLELDIYYINNAGIMLDLKIILKTVKVVITGDGAR